MFPGTGFDFVRTILMLRQQAFSTSNDGVNYSAALEGAQHFYFSIEAAKEDVRCQAEDNVIPAGLKDYLLLG